MSSRTRYLIPVILNVAGATLLTAQVSTTGPRYAAPTGGEIVKSHANDFRDLLDRFSRDRETLQRQFPSKMEPKRISEMENFFKEWHRLLLEMDFNQMNRSGKVDYILFRQKLERDQQQFTDDANHLKTAAKLLPFIEKITALEYEKRAQGKYNPQELAPRLEQLSQDIDREGERIRKEVMKSRKHQKEHGRDESAERIFKSAEEGCRELQRVVDNWFNYYRGYDPLLTWWITAPSKKLSSSLGAYADTFKPDPKTSSNPTQKAPPKDFNAENHAPPVGAEHLTSLLAREMIPYTAGELVEIGKKELAWCVEQQKKASNELGFGDNVTAALEHVKTKHVPPGEQSSVIRRLALEAIDYLEDNALVTIPQLAKDSWRVGMMSPGRQRYNPFFTGGSTISVSYPHLDMNHADKLMSMRGNNPHFSAATVHHELIPGHHLQDFMTSRYNTHRGIYRTVFWTEGWALYWEMLLWDRRFPKTAEDRMGFLFWRMHRCVRIIFSLGYHLDQFTPQQCVDMLVDIVGHERTHAEGEVRRSLAPGTPVLYQCAYMLGGMQFHVLHKELVASGKMTPREFHDQILRGNRIPVEMVRAEISDIPLSRDYRSNWRFAEQFKKN